MASICWRSRETRTDRQPLNIENRMTPLAAGHPFLRPAPDMSPAAQKRRAMSRATSWILVALVHVAIFFGMVITFHPFENKPRSVTETFFYLSAPGNTKEAPPVQLVSPEMPNNGPPTITVAPAIVPKPPELDDRNTRPVTPGDILGAVGRELACSAGNWEHLTGPERQVCGGAPWRAMRLPNGNLVMVPPASLPRLKQAPDTGFSLNGGADRIQRDLQNGQNPANNGCPILQQMPCTHVTPGWDGPQ